MEWIGYSAFIVQLGKQTIKESNVAQKQQVVLKALHNLSKQGHQFTFHYYRAHAYLLT